MRHLSRASLFILVVASTIAPAAAQDASAPNLAGAKPSAAKAAVKKTATAKPASHKPDPYQSPWATITQSHLWTKVPEAQDFVRDSRPAPKDLKYTPLQSQLGADPVRPKPRDAANVMALQAELEASLAHNEARGGQGAKAKRRAKANAAAE